MRPKSVILCLTLLLAGCATVPTGPSVLVLPGSRVPFEVFQADDLACRQWASYQIGGKHPGEARKESTASGAAVGTVVGTGVGAALGAAAGDAGTGAAIGAGSGLLFGTASGASAGEYYGNEAQMRYDYAYMQCMYAKGNQIPGVPQKKAPTPPPPPAKKPAPKTTPAP